MILADDLIQEISSLNGLNLIKYNFTELFEFMRKEDLIIQSLKKENRKLKLIIEHGLGPKDLERDI